MVHDILQYFKNPDASQEANVFNTQKVKLFWTSFWMIMVCNLGLSVLIYGVEALGWVSMDSHAVMEMIKEESFIFIIFATVVLAPLLEEIIFRAPLGLFKSASPLAFKWTFYGFALAFGAVHISNYQVDPTTAILLFPILTAPQIVAGLFLGLIRVKVGLLYSMLFHAIYNFVLVVPSVVFMKYFEM